MTKCILPIIQILLFGALLSQVNGERYEPTWESLNSRPLPEWFDDAKFGIFIHWGIYSVPSLEGENHWTQCIGVPSCADAREQHYRSFAKNFTAELFDPNEWVALFEAAGARYIIITAKHNDGFRLWPSQYSEGFNSMEIGAKRDLIGDLSNSVKSSSSLKFGIYYSYMQTFDRLFHNERDSGFAQSQFVDQVVMPELTELFTKYQPELLWNNGQSYAGGSDVYWNSKKFLTWLFNDSPVKDTIVTSDDWGLNSGCTRACYGWSSGERSEKKEVKAMTIDNTAWFYRARSSLEDYQTSVELIRELVQAVSIGKNFLLNIGPTRRGTISPIFELRLRDIGKWLRINGAAIYSTKPWIVSKDGDNTNIWYTAAKHNANYGRTIVYAILLDYPYDTNSITLHSLAGKTDMRTTISMFGLASVELEWTEKNGAVNVILPSLNLSVKNKLDFAWTLKIDLPRYEESSNKIINL